MSRRSGLPVRTSRPPATTISDDSSDEDITLTPPPMDDGDEAKVPSVVQYPPSAPRVRPREDDASDTRSPVRAKRFVPHAERMPQGKLGVLFVVAATRSDDTQYANKDFQCAYVKTLQHYLDTEPTMKQAAKENVALVLNSCGIPGLPHDPVDGSVVQGDAIVTARWQDWAWVWPDLFVTPEKAEAHASIMHFVTLGMRGAHPWRARVVFVHSAMMASGFRFLGRWVQPFLSEQLQSSEAYASLMGGDAPTSALSESLVRGLYAVLRRGERTIKSTFAGADAFVGKPEHQLPTNLLSVMALCEMWNTCRVFSAPACLYVIRLGLLVGVPVHVAETKPPKAWCSTSWCIPWHAWNTTLLIVGVPLQHAASAVCSVLMAYVLWGLSRKILEDAHRDLGPRTVRPKDVRVACRQAYAMLCTDIHTSSLRLSTMYTPILTMAAMLDVASLPYRDDVFGTALLTADIPNLTFVDKDYTAVDDSLYDPARAIYVLQQRMSDEETSSVIDLAGYRPQEHLIPSMSALHNIAKVARADKLRTRGAAVSRAVDVVAGGAVSNATQRMFQLHIVQRRVRELLPWFPDVQSVVQEEYTAADRGDVTDYLRTNDVDVWRLSDGPDAVEGTVSEFVALKLALWKTRQWGMAPETALGDNTAEVYFASDGHVRLKKIENLAMVKPRWSGAKGQPKIQIMHATVDAEDHWSPLGVAETLLRKFLFSYVRCGVVSPHSLVITHEAWFSLCSGLTSLDIVQVAPARTSKHLVTQSMGRMAIRVERTLRKGFAMNNRKLLLPHTNVRIGFRAALDPSSPLARLLFNVPSNLLSPCALLLRTATNNRTAFQRLLMSGPTVSAEVMDADDIVTLVAQNRNTLGPMHGLFAPTFPLDFFNDLRDSSKAVLVASLDEARAWIVCDSVASKKRVLSCIYKSVESRAGPDVGVRTCVVNLGDFMHLAMDLSTPTMHAWVQKS